MRRSGLALVAAGALCTVSALLPVVHAAAEDEPGSGLGSFALSGFAAGVQLRVAEPSFCYASTAGKNGCEGAVPESTASLQSGPNGSALAAIAWPGGLAADLGDLLITASGGQLPSQATLLNDPVRAEVRTGQSPDTVTYDQVPGSTMKATAKATETSAQAFVQGTGLPVGSVGPASTSASSTVTGPASAVATAKSSVQDIELGVVKIGAVQSEATATTNGKTATVKGSTKVTGATVANIPVTIDERGVTVNGSGVAVKALTDQVNAALSQAGITLRLSEPQGKPDGSSVSYTSGSLVAVFEPQAGNQFSVSFGGANVTAQSVEAITFDPPTTGGTTGGTTGFTATTGGAGTSGSGGTGGTGGFSGDPGTTGGVPTTPGTTSGGVQPPQTFTPELAATSGRLYGGISPVLGVLALLGVGLMLAGFKRLPDKVLEYVPPLCPLEES